MTGHRQFLLRTVAPLLALGLLLAAPALAQVTAADITGRVSDQAGAAVANATVTARNTGTGLSRSTQTNDSGDYTITQLPAGNYEITVEATNFSKARLANIELNVGTSQTLNFDLKPGQVTEIVEVTTDLVLVETTRSDIGGVVTQNEVENLPLLNRTFANLSVIMPEARPVGNFDPTKTRIGTVAFNGGDGRQVDVSVDGGDNKDNVVGSLIQNFAYESIQEFQVLQHRWTAEAGRAVGGVVNVISKSGTNEFHGSAFANFRDEALRARDFFEKPPAAATELDKPPFSRQEFGGSVGGPLKRDRAWFFGTYERFRERQNNSVRPTALPQLAAIPGVNATSIIPTPYDDHLLTAKIDQKITEAQSIFYRFSMQKNSSPNDQIAVPATSDLTNGNTNDNKSYSFVGSHTWTVSPTKVNQFTFHYQDFNNAILGVTSEPNLVFPTVQSGRNINVPQATLENKYQFRDDFSWTAGDHGLKFGTNYIHTRLDGFFFFGAQGYQVTFFDDPLVISTNRIPDPAAPGGFRVGPYTEGFATRGAVRQITFSDGQGDHRQTIHQLAFYAQDDWKARRNLTFNLGLRWDANIGNLPTQNDNRTIRILQQLNDPRARAITGDPGKLLRQTPSFTEFQPRVGFAWDPTGSGRTVIRGGYGIFYDQLFQNLTLFSLTQSNPELYQTIVTLQNTGSAAAPAGALAGFRFGIDPLPPVPADFNISELSFGGFGRINDPDATEPYVQKFSIGFETQLGRGMTLSSDFTHTLGLHEPRVQVINPLIKNVCDPAFPGSTPGSARCVRGANSRYFDLALVQAGFAIRPGPGGDITRGSARIEQINMIGTTNRSLYDSWATTLRRRTRKTTLSASYVLSNSRSWGGQPVASYSGNGIAVAPEDQFKPEEFGPTRIDERHRVVVSGVFDLPWNFQLAPIAQLASARPYSLNAGVDLDGDGLTTNDRICEGTDPAAVFAARGSSAAILALNPLGCRQVQVNSVRTGFITDAAGNVIEERSGRFFNVDLRAQKTFQLGERFAVKGYLDFFNLFNTENLSFASRLGISTATSRPAFRQPVSLYGPGFGPPVGRPFTLQLGGRFEF